MPIIKPKLKHYIICDDVRHEVGNKLTFVGVYTKDLFIPDVPFSFPKLCVFLYYEKAKGGFFYSIKLFDPSGKKIGKPIEFEIPKDLKKPQEFGMTATFAPLTIEKEGTYRLEVKYKAGREYVDNIEFAIKCAID